MRANHWFEEWMVEKALPLWSGPGVDPDGAFFETLDFDGTPNAASHRRVRVQFRQIFACSAASLLNLAPGGDDAAMRAFDRASARAWAPDGAPGWVHLLSADGRVQDAKRDAYDQAFALLGLAWLNRARPGRAVMDAIERTVSFVDANFAARSGGWWETVGREAREAPGEPQLRRQNPHMHALEAMLALYESTGERGYLDRAREIYHLFAARFYDWTSNVVIEYFDADWRPASRARQRVEPGHMAEWVYLIREYERLTGETVDAIADPLYAKTVALGLDPSGRFLVDELYLDGSPSKRTRRLWPQTEYLKATLAQYRAKGDEALRLKAEGVLADLIEEYLCGDEIVEGGWIDAFDLDGGRVAADMPASTLYHLFSAFVLSRDLLARRSRRPTSARSRTAPCEAGGTGSTTALGPVHAEPAITPVILAGGRGSRLWPLSKPEAPKQFLALLSERSLFQETLARLADRETFKPAIVVCGRDQAAAAEAQADAMKVRLDRMILEPEARNSAPAILAAAIDAHRRDPDAILLATPADHAIRETALFSQLFANAVAAAEDGAIVAFGVTPTRPETAYGYIRAGAPTGVGGAFEVAEFIEKPDQATARSFLATGSYLWNSGLLLFRAETFIEEARRWNPAMLDALQEAVAAGECVAEAGCPKLALAEKPFARCPSVSVDYAIMEKTDRAAVYSAALTWSDIGAWDEIALARDGDARGNASFGRTTMVDCRGVYAHAVDGAPHVAVAGLKDVIVIATGDTVLITSKDKAQSIEEVARIVEAERAPAPTVPAPAPLLLTEEGSRRPLRPAKLQRNAAKPLFEAARSLRRDSFLNGGSS
ncbi:MAG: AGE family epimerase/isomerase [Pseudomonadota bacterium]